MQPPSTLPQQIRVTELHGLNERVSPSQLRPGEFSYLEGLYPSQSGLLSRVPGKELLATVPGNSQILSFCQTFNRNGDVLVQTRSGILAYTLDELYGRQTVPNLTPGTTPGTNVEEEGMSMAILYQEEANGVAGGSLDGWISGSPNTALINTFYGRRLTKNPVNQSSTIVSFTASTGGSGAVSTAGQFVLAPGTYRIKGELLFGSVGANNTQVEVGLYNVTNGGFQLDDGTGSTTAQPIKASASAFSNGVTGFNANFGATLRGRFIVSSSSNTFEIRQAALVQATARQLDACGYPSGMSNSGVFMGGAAPLQRYAWVEILKEP